MSEDHKTPATGDDVDKVRNELRRHIRDVAQEQEDLHGRSWTVLLGAAGIAQWILLTMPWFTVQEDEVIDGQLSGWGLLLAGLRGVVEGDGGSDRVLAFVVGIMPPLACLLAIALIWWCVASPTRRKADAAQFVSIVAGLGFVGLYVVVGGLSQGDSDFAAPMFAAMTLWFVTAAIARQVHDRR